MFFTATAGKKGDNPQGFSAVAAVFAPRRHWWAVLSAGNKAKQERRQMHEMRQCVVVELISGHKTHFAVGAAGRGDVLPKSDQNSSYHDCDRHNSSMVVEPNEERISDPWKRSQ